MAEASNTTVTLQVHRFTPRPERAERVYRGGSLFASSSCPAAPGSGGAPSSARQAVVQE